jgi:hypothetical protein
MLITRLEENLTLNPCRFGYPDQYLAYSTHPLIIYDLVLPKFWRLWSSKPNTLPEMKERGTSIVRAHSKNPIMVKR